MADRISSLPDDVICRILYLIPAKSAVKTSILSKRWKYMWAKVPVLDLTEMTHMKTYENLTREQITCFHSFLGRVLLHNDIQHMVELIRTISGVKSIKLKTCAVCEPLNDLPIIFNLTSFKLEMVEDNGVGVLKCAPKLNCWILSEVLRWNYSSESELESELVCQPMPYLEYAEIDCFVGHEFEMRLIRYLLKASPVLKVVRIMVDPNLGILKMETYEELWRFYRTNWKVSIKIVHCSTY